MTELALDARVLAGPLAGAALFGLLAGGRLPRARPALRRSLARRWARLGLRAAGEELVWRGLVLGGLAVLIGPPAALALSSAGFAASHWPALGRSSVVHLLTGAAFGVAFLIGGLVTAALAHAVYNVLVDWAVLAQRREAPGP
jgi:hypothetical protein